MTENQASAIDTQAAKHEIVVPSTARYYTLGELRKGTREVWFVLHGYGQLARYFLRRFTPIADASRLIVAPEGQSRFYLDVPKYQRVGASWMTREDRLTDIEDQRVFLDAVFKKVLPNGLPAGVRLVLFGFSQGTATAWRWAIGSELPFHHMVLWAGSIPLEPHPAGFFEGKSLELYLGLQDEIIPPARAEQYVAELAEKGIHPTVTWYPGDHTVPEAPLQALAARLRGE